MEPKGRRSEAGNPDNMPRYRENPNGTVRDTQRGRTLTWKQFMTEVNEEAPAPTPTDRQCIARVLELLRTEQKDTSVEFDDDDERAVAQGMIAQAVLMVRYLGELAR